MRDETSASFESFPPKADVCVADGYGIRVFVRRRHLVVQDGLGRDRRERSFARATASIKRLVVIGHEGFVSLEAFRWMADLGIAFIHLDRDGKVIGASAPPGNDDARLRRAQAFAKDTELGTEVARWILDLKLRGQSNVLAGLGAVRARSAVEEARRTLRQVESTDELMSTPEARAAAAYWDAWTSLPIQFVRRDESRVPAHWKGFGPRRSPLSGSPRLAFNPANALLNYLYRLLEAETRIACLTVGLDPGLGFFHKDKRGRDNLVMDLMEASRPQVDAYALRLFEAHLFSALDFYETRKGVCRILPPLSHQLAETSLLWAKAIAPISETVAKMLGKPRRVRVDRPPTPLTRRNRHRGNGEPAPRPPTSFPRRRCRQCGAMLSSRTRAYCESCISGQADDNSALKKAAASARAQAALAEWRQASIESPPAETFQKEILPRLQGLAVRVMTEATGLSETYCYRVRRGEVVPHVRHWDPLRRVGEAR